MINQ